MLVRERRLYITRYITNVCLWIILFMISSVEIGKKTIYTRMCILLHTTETSGGLTHAGMQGNKAERGSAQTMTVALYWMKAMGRLCVCVLGGGGVEGRNWHSITPTTNCNFCLQQGSNSSKDQVLTRELPHKLVLDSCNNYKKKKNYQDRREFTRIYRM